LWTVKQRIFSMS